MSRPDKHNYGSLNEESGAVHGGNRPSVLLVCQDLS